MAIAGRHGGRAAATSGRGLALAILNEIDRRAKKGFLGFGNRRELKAYILDLPVEKVKTFVNGQRKSVTEHTKRPFYRIAEAHGCRSIIAQFERKGKPKKQQRPGRRTRPS